MKQISIGTENFKRIIDQNCYYVDKTQLIENVLTNDVMLYTRPRRFGKTLNMSMLYYFFSNKEKANAYLFDGLKITQHTDMMQHQNQYPTLFLTFKDLSRERMDLQMDKFSSMISIIMDQNTDLLDSARLTDTQKHLLRQYHARQASDSDLRDCLYYISLCLYQHYQKKVIILIDEYDVPLQSAYLHGYYDEMVLFLRGVLSAAFKTNDALERGVLTGCLRIAKESIFTGLNNFTVRSITDQYASDCFGFTQDEIDQLLAYYHLTDKREEMKQWYDGYLFGQTEIYNPWSTMNYAAQICGDHQFPATSFWANTSGNDIVRKYIENSTREMRDEFEILANGGTIEKRLKPELTYREMTFDTKEDMNDDIYSFLLYTGYLKLTGKVRNKGLFQYHELTLPNLEVKTIYQIQFEDWFNIYQQKTKNEFVINLNEGKEIEAEKILNQVLRNSISFYDNYESFYHGFMLGYLTTEGYKVVSNMESGEGRFDIVILPESVREQVIIIECKHSKDTSSLEEDSKKAVDQITKKKYQEGLLAKGYKKSIGYGIAFYKKQCFITKQ